MTTTAWWLIAATVVIALVDWFAVATERKLLEYVAKPATMIPLIGAAATLTPQHAAMRPWFVAALVFSLAGDVFLMLPNPKMFVPGLGSFLVGHVLYIIGFFHAHLSPGWLFIGGVVVFVLVLSIGPTVVKGASEVDKVLGLPVLVYMLTISVMVTCSFGSSSATAMYGAVLFYLSDLCIGWSRFVKDFTNSRMAIIVTYHVAQILLVVSLAR